MRTLVIYCHPDPDSFCAAVREAALAGLNRAGHEVRLIDLYAIGFDPVMSREDRRNYYERGRNEEKIAEHVAHLRWAEALIFVYPTWWYGQPAMLRGWVERVFVPHVTFAMPEPGQKLIGPLMTHIKLIAGVTTLGSPRWWWWRMGQPGRRVLLTGLGALAHKKCKKLWIALHSMDHITQGDRAAFLQRVTETLAATKGLV